MSVVHCDIVLVYLSFVIKTVSLNSAMETHIIIVKNIRWTWALLGLVEIIAKF